MNLNELLLENEYLIKVAFGGIITTIIFTIKSLIKNKLSTMQETVEDKKEIIQAKLEEKVIEMAEATDRKLESKMETMTNVMNVFAESIQNLRQQFGELPKEMLNHMIEYFNNQIKESDINEK